MYRKRAKDGRHWSSCNNLSLIWWNTRYIWYLGILSISLYTSGKRGVFKGPFASSVIGPSVPLDIFEKYSQHLSKSQGWAGITFCNHQLSSLLSCWPLPDWPVPTYWSDILTRYNKESVHALKECEGTAGIRGMLLSSALHSDRLPRPRLSGSRAESARAVMADDAPKMGVIWVQCKKREDFLR